MGNYEVSELPELDRDALIKILTDELPVLRAKIGISQDDISGIIGISRQTYNAIETKKRKMSWNTYMSLILFFGYNEKTTNIVESIGAFPSSLRKTLLKLTAPAVVQEYQLDKRNVNGVTNLLSYQHLIVFTLCQCQK